MTTFGLVHGAYHGPWCWQPLIDEPKRRGLCGLTVDLPGEDSDAGASEYAQVALDAFADSVRGIQTFVFGEAGGLVDL